MTESSPLIFSPDASGSTDDAGQAIDDGRGRILPCDSCGADFEFHIGQQSLKCPFCGFEKQIEFADDEEVAEQDFHTMVARMREMHDQDRREVEGFQEIRCESCGGQTVFQGTLTSSECPFCGSPVQLEDVHDAEHRVPVDGVLPFLVERDAARTNLKTWVESRWFAPNEFLRRGVKGQFNGVYLPFWTYDSMTFTRYRGERGEYYYVTVGSGDNKRQERRTRWYPASGKFSRFFDDVLILGTGGLRRDLMHALEPWPLGKCVPFNQEMLAGYLARTYDVELEPGFDIARERIAEAIQADVVNRIGGDTQRVESVKVRHNAITFKHLLLPVWLLAYRYHDKPYQVMINAATGEVQGERPYSIAKITMAVLAGIAVVAGFFLLQSR